MVLLFDRISQNCFISRSSVAAFGLKTQPNNINQYGITFFDIERIYR